MENSNHFNSQLHNVVRDNRGKSHVSTELQLKCSLETTHRTPRTTLPSCSSHFQVSTKPGPDDSVTEVTVTEIRKTQFLTSSSTLDRLLPFSQGSSLVPGGDSQEFRLLSSYKNSLPSCGEIGEECRNPPVLSLPDSHRGGENQKSLPTVPENEPIELNMGREVPPQSDFYKKFGPNGANVIPKFRFVPSRQDSSISLGRETQKKFHLSQTKPNDKDEPNSSTNISPPPDFSDKNGLGGANEENSEQNEEFNRQNRAVGRIRSLPHPKNGPYECPHCLTTYPTSQHYAAHVSARHRSETLGEKKKRDNQKLKNKKYKMVRCPDGLTLVKDQPSKPIDNEPEVVLGCKIQNGVVLNEEIRSHVREKKTEKTIEGLQRPYVREPGKRRSPEEEVSSNSSNDYKRNPNWKGPFGYLKRTGPMGYLKWLKPR